MSPRINCALKIGLSPFSWRLLDHLTGELVGSVTQLQQILSCALQALPLSPKGLKLAVPSFPLPCTQNIIQRGLFYQRGRIQNPNPRIKPAVPDLTFQKDRPLTHSTGRWRSTSSLLEGKRSSIASPHLAGILF